MVSQINGTPINYTPLNINRDKLPVSKLVFVGLGLISLVVFFFAVYNVLILAKERRNQSSVRYITPTPVPTTKLTLTPTSTPKVSPSQSLKNTGTKSSVKVVSKITPTPTKAIVQPTSTPTPTTRVHNPPNMTISYPSENQSISLNSSQQFCLVDVPNGGGQTGLARRQNINNSGWTNYASITTLCYTPTEGQNTVVLQYKNSYGDESVQYERHFTFHRLQEFTVTLITRLYSDNNCNGNWDSGEGNVTTLATVNIFQMPSYYIINTGTSRNDGVYNSYTYDKVLTEGDSISLMASPVSPSGYKSNPKYSDQTATLNSTTRSSIVNIPQVPNENIGACQ